MQAQAGFSLEGYAYYIASERRAKKPDIFVLKGLYERAIAEADKRRFAGEPNAEQALQSFWTEYVGLLVRRSPQCCVVSVGTLTALCMLENGRHRR